MTRERQTVFPRDIDYAARALEVEPILIDGMKVVFDKKVGLYPVDLAPQEKSDGSGTAGRRDRG